MTNVIQLGLGPIGQRLTRYLAEREGIAVIGGVDPDPQIVGKDIGVWAGIEKKEFEIAENFGSCSNLDEADVAVISTVSSLQDIETQIKEAADYRLDIVSTCEELSHPWQTHPECSKRIDMYCRKKGVTCVGTGVNPGFLMDYLPSVLTSVCRKVEHVRVERVQDALPRRKPFRDKIGAGLTKEEFEQKRAIIRHVGLPESVYMIADAMNWELNSIQETLRPILAEKNIQDKKVNIKQGNVAGVQQVAHGYKKDQEVITLVFKAAIGIEESYDSIRIKGTPGFTSTIPGGINGDIATSAIMVNAIRSVQKAEAGLKTMLDIPAPTYLSKMSNVTVPQ